MDPEGVKGEGIETSAEFLLRPMVLMATSHVMSFVFPTDLGTGRHYFPMGPRK